MYPGPYKAGPWHCPQRQHSTTGPRCLAAGTGLTCPNLPPVNTHADRYTLIYGPFYGSSHTLLFPTISLVCVAVMAFYALGGTLGPSQSTDADDDAIPRFSYLTKPVCQPDFLSVFDLVSQ